ncbi:MAG: hypothetical protein KatS3mg060_0606 [Dehalococcoidia bacterium]|nr:MAG: hypothetical protein KatS3mg060_0606 [Dehalococcoidia bacterium]
MSPKDWAAILDLIEENGADAVRQSFGVLVAVGLPPRVALEQIASRFASTPPLPGAGSAIAVLTGGAIAIDDPRFEAEADSAFRRGCERALTALRRSADAAYPRPPVVPAAMDSLPWEEVVSRFVSEEFARLGQPVTVTRHEATWTFALSDGTAYQLEFVNGVPTSVGAYSPPPSATIAAHQVFTALLQYLREREVGRRPAFERN